MTDPHPEATQTVAWIESPGPSGTLTIRPNVPIQRPGPRELLVHLECSGICHSDCRNVEGLGAYTPIPGHEGVGRVVALGPDAPQDLLGQRVGIKWLWSACNKCSACRKGCANNCARQMNTGRSVLGTLQEYAVAHSDFVTLIPDGVKSEIAAPLLCAGLSLAGAVSKLEPEVRKGEWVVIVGAGGGLGHIGVQIAALKGYRVLAVDSGAEKRRLCEEMGAEVFVDYATEDVERRVKQVCSEEGEEEGAHGLICVAGSERAYEQALGLVRNTGVFVCVGLPPDSFMFPLSPIWIANRGLIIKGSSTGSAAQMDELLQLAKEGRITPRVETFAFEHAPGIIRELQRYEVGGRKVVWGPR